MKHVGRISQVTNRTFNFAGKINNKYIVGFVSKLNKKVIIELHEAETTEEIVTIKSAQFNLSEKLI